MLYVIFNQDGSINTLVVGESINQGNNNVNQIFAAVNGYPTSDYTCVAEFELPNGELEELNGVQDEQELGIEIYSGYTVSLSEDVTRLAGNLKLNLKLIDLNDNVLCTYQVTLKVNPTGYEPNDTHITEAQYNSLIQSLNSYVLKAEAKYYKYFPIYISSTSGTLNATEINALENKDVYISYGDRIFIKDGLDYDGTNYYYRFVSYLINAGSTNYNAIEVSLIRINTITYEYNYTSSSRNYYTKDKTDDLLKGKLNVITVDGSETFQTLLNDYGDNVNITLSIIVKYSNRFYTLGINSTHDGYGWVEMESLSGIERYEGDVNLLTTISAFLSNSSYQKYYLRRSDLTPTTATGSGGTSIADVGSTGHNGFSFYVGTDRNGIYTFTYGNCIVQLPIYDLLVNTEYKVAAALVDGDGNYANKVLTYKIDSSNNLLIYQKQDYIPVGWTGYLSKIKLY